MRRRPCESSGSLPVEKERKRLYDRQRRVFASFCPLIGTLNSHFFFFNFSLFVFSKRNNPSSGFLLFKTEQNGSVSLFPWRRNERDVELDDKNILSMTNDDYGHLVFENSSDSKTARIGPIPSKATDEIYETPTQTQNIISERTPCTT
jgi:hypothetical protein